MTPIVYIDMLFLLNVFMDTITIYSASLITKKSISPLRLLFTSAVLSLYSCAMFFPPLKFFYTMVGKILILFWASILAFPSKNIRIILKNALIFFAVSGVFGGVIFAAVFLTNFGTTIGAAVSNGEIYLDIKASTLLFSLAIAYTSIYLISYIKRRNINASLVIYDAKITLFEKTITVPLLKDTGCLLCDFNNRPAIILSQNASKNLVPKDILKALSGVPDINFLGKYAKRYSLLSFSTIDKKAGILHAFTPDKVIIGGKEIPSSVIALSNRPLSQGPHFEGIFNPMLICNHDEPITKNI